MKHPFFTNPDGSIQFRNAQFYRNGTVECEVNHKEYGWIPFLATDYDPEDYGRELHRYLTQECANEIAPVDTAALEAEDASFIRDERNSILKSTDWTQLPDVPEALRNTWATYRQELRDVPQQDGFPNDITWPTQPVS